MFEECEDWSTPRACDKKWHGSGQLLEFLEGTLASEILGSSVSYFLVRVSQVFWLIRLLNI